MFYCAEFPVGLISFPKRDDKKRKGQDLSFLPALKADIAARGMVNPVIIRNHMGGKYAGNWCIYGQNRMLCVEELGWKTVPALVTGPLPEGVVGDSISSLEDADRYVHDGRLKVTEYGLGYEDILRPEGRRYPEVRSGKRRQASPPTGLVCEEGPGGTASGSTTPLDGA